MKRNIQYVPKDKLVAMAKRLGCTITEQKGFIKVTGQSPNRAVYIGNGKQVGRVDLSGFTHPMAIDHPKPPTKRVQQWLDFEKDEKSVLTAFWTVCKDGLMSGGGEELEGEAGAEAVAADRGVDVDELVAELEGEQTPGPAAAEDVPDGRTERSEAAEAQTH